MRDRVKELLTYNEEFVNEGKYVHMVTSSVPQKKMVVLSCMDTRLTELLPKALNLRNGDAKFVKNAGATIMHPFGSITRSILVAIYEFEVDDVLVIGHHGCGMAKLDGQLILKKAKDRGITASTLDTLRNSGIDIDRWLTGFESASDAVKESVLQLRKHPLMPDGVHIHGFLMHPETGRLEYIVEM